MKRISKILLLGGVAAAAFVALLAALFLLMPGGGEDSAEASGGTGNPPTIFGIDVDPTGNSCTPPIEDPPQDGYCTLGTIDKCIRVESTETGTYPGPVFNVDVFLDDIPTGKDLAGGDWFMHYDSAHLKVNRILPSPARCNAWLLGMKLGSGCADNGERPTVALPDTNGILNVSMVDGNGQLSAELPGVAGQDRGVLDRYELAVTAAGPALAQITFQPAPTYFASSSVGRYNPTQVWDANYTPQYGLIAIDTPCPEGPPADSDGDGIPDSEDACPNEPEDFDGFWDDDGCPDVNLLVHIMQNGMDRLLVDTDGDGICDPPDDQADPHADNPIGAIHIVRTDGWQPTFAQPSWQLENWGANASIVGQGECRALVAAIIGLDRPDIEGQQCVSIRSSSAGDTRIGLAYRTAGGIALVTGSVIKTWIVTDTDGDGIPDSEDACPNEPEDFDQDEDGCPGFSFAIITDLHLGDSYDLKYENYDYYPIRRLQRAVQWINEQPQIKLVFVLGDISDHGDKDVLERARKELENLRPGLSFVPLLGNHDVQDGTAQNFKTVFGDLLQRVREIRECGPAGSDDLQNFSFTYRGVRFIGLDFVARNRNLGSAALLHTDTRKCLIAALQKPSPEGEPVIILAHHPLLEADEVGRLYDPYVPQTAGCLRGHVPWQVMTFLNPFAISGLGGLINTLASEREVFTFGGHLHGTRMIGVGEVETCELPVFSANQDLTHTTLGSPIVITEALKNGSNQQSKGFIRIVKVKGTNVDVGQIEGSSMAALNPDFHWSRPAPCPAGMASLMCGLQRAFTRSPVIFHADTYTNRDIDCYMWDFGDGTCNADCGARQEQTYKRGGVYNVCLTVFGKDVATPRLPDEPEGERIQETICKSVTVK
jgi:hypothetical protein